MLEATSYRYEVMQPKQRTLANTGAQAIRIKEDEFIEAMEQQLKRETKINQRANWDDKCQLKTEYKRIKAGESIVRGEMHIAAKCLVEVRRAALKRLLEAEMAQYTEELNANGKTFHKQRI
ncbi:hypothetical protein EB796_009710 [Bugula neritina]|uniref:Uncharacterized protein n=1 Tax=Bugula neritina TaxID=10212 RepID=A0A7J7JJH2_BUGNE|nr:hypothetical protein EB796_016164 [Bugula neritina]KAF6031988.1 hypothetical protein EB796_009710 [Bugula neritina]